MKDGRTAVFTLLKPFDKGLLKTAKASALGLALCAAFGAAALAGELPKKGTYSISWTASGPYTAVEIGEEKWAWSSRFTVVIWNDAGEGIYHNMSANCVGMGTNERELAPFTDSGYCSYVDADGDKIFEYYYEKETGKGTTTLLGGTGRYAGIQGSDTYEYVSTPDAPQGTFNQIGHSKGSYTLP